MIVLKNSLDKNNSALLLLAVLFLLFAASDILLAQDDGAAWLKRIDDAERIQHSYGILEQTITTSSGGIRTFQMRSWSDENGDVSLLEYTAPVRVKGDKILQRDGGDNIWYYMNRQDVTRHYSGHTRRQSANGSDFSYEDMATGKMTEDYTALLVSREDIDGKNCIKLKLTPTETGPSYDYLVLWAGSEDALTRKIDYYDDGKLLKTLIVSDFREVEGRNCAFRMEMSNHLEGSSTTLVYKKLTFSNKPESWIFTKGALSRQID